MYQCGINEDWEIRGSKKRETKKSLFSFGSFLNLKSLPTLNFPDSDPDFAAVACYVSVHPNTFNKFNYLYEREHTTTSQGSTVRGFLILSCCPGHPLGSISFKFNRSSFGPHNPGFQNFHSLQNYID